jgi:hypothetical protein
LNPFRKIALKPAFRRGKIAVHLKGTLNDTPPMMRRSFAYPKFYSREKIRHLADFTISGDGQ